MKQAWKRDRLGVLGIGSVFAAFLLWALPIDCGYWGCGVSVEPPWVGSGSWFRIGDDYGLYDEVQWIIALLALASALLLFRRR